MAGATRMALLVALVVALVLFVVLVAVVVLAALVLLVVSVIRGGVWVLHVGWCVRLGGSVARCVRGGDWEGG